MDGLNIMHTVLLVLKVMSIAMAASSTIFNRRCKPRQEGANRTIPSDGQKLTKKLLTISLTIF